VYFVNAKWIYSITCDAMDNCNLGTVDLTGLVSFIGPSFRYSNAIVNGFAVNQTHAMFTGVPSSGPDNVVVARLSNGVVEATQSLGRNFSVLDLGYNVKTRTIYLAALNLSAPYAVSLFAWDGNPSQVPSQKTRLPDDVGEAISVSFLDYFIFATTYNELVFYNTRTDKIDQQFTVPAPWEVMDLVINPNGAGPTILHGWFANTSSLTSELAFAAVDPVHHLINVITSIDGYICDPAFNRNSQSAWFDNVVVTSLYDTNSALYFSVLNLTSGDLSIVPNPNNNVAAYAAFATQL